MRDEPGAVLRRRVRIRAQNCCEYCGLPDSASLFPHEPDHIIAIKHGGKTTEANLAYACFECNRAKGSDIASVDPMTGTITPLFSPRTQQWSDHFRLNGPIIEPLTAAGRVTVTLLKINLSIRIALRTALRSQAYDVPSE